MAGTEQKGWPTDEALLAAAAGFTTLRDLAEHIGKPVTTLKDRLRRQGILAQAKAALKFTPPTDRPGISYQGNGTSSVASDPANQPPVPWKPEELLRVHGLDPDEWEITRVRGNRWGDPGEPMHQLRVDVIPRSLLLAVPDPSDWAPPKPPPLRKATATAPLRAVVISDHHAPHHDPEFHSLFLAYLRDEQPDLIEVNGDLLDFSTISRHREREGYAQPVNECLRAGFGILRDFREIAPEATIRLKRGNHDERLLHAILDNNRELHKIAPADEETPALDLRRLLHLAELGVEYVDEEWDQAKTRLSSKLTARHGFSTSKNAGDQMLDKLSGSTIQGHTHRLSMTLRTEHTDDSDEPIRVRMAMEGGCACIIPGGLGYVPGGEPNWQNACALFHIWPDGDFLAAPGVFVPGRFLAPSGKRYAA